MNETLSALELDQIAAMLQRQSEPYEGYPAQGNRLYLGTAGLYLSGVTLIVPDGPWHVRDHVNRQGKNPDLLDPEVPSPGSMRVSSDLSERWQKAGLMLDQYGRAIHPNWRQLLADKRIGLPTGLGYFWRHGPNETADGVVYRKPRANASPELLLIKRARGGQWALPGGFRDKDDGSMIATARREVGEETHLKQVGGPEEIILFRRRTGVITTLTSWTENTVVLIHGDQDYLFDVEPNPGDDAIDVGWFSRDQITLLDLFDIHSEYVDLAYAHPRLQAT